MNKMFDTLENISASNTLTIPNGRVIDLSHPVVMGIINVTPDSFYDGGKFATPELAVEQALRMISDGAEIIDIGGESTRPGADAVSQADELSRVIPVVEALRRQSNVAISVDTYKSEVAKAALKCGADIINDISAGTMDAKMIPLIAETDAAYVMMHMQGVPQNMQENPQYDDVVTEVGDFLRERIQYCLSAGIAANRLVVDPGIGFGKTFEHNISLLNNIAAFTAFGAPVLIGVSRKSFIGKLGDGSGASDKHLGGSIAAALAASAQGAAILRAHDVRETAQALKVFSAVAGFSNISSFSAVDRV